MNAEQIGAAEVTANMFSGKGEVLIFLIWFENGSGKEAGSSKTYTGLRYCFQGFGCCIKYVGAASALNVDVDEAWGDYSALSVKDIIVDYRRFDLTDLRNGAVFDENGGCLFIAGSVKQSAVGYKKFF
mgnify:CR=1 FL=1